MRTIKRIKISGTNFLTIGTGLASHVWVDENNFFPLNFSFVFDEVLQLVEAPAMKPSIESLTFFNLSYSFKILQNNCIGRRYNLLTDFVICPSHVTFLPTGDFSKQSLSGLCAFSLKFFPQILKLDNFGFVTSEDLAVGSDSKVVYSEINTHCRTTNIVGIDLSRERDIDKHLIFYDTKVSSLVVPIQILPIINWNINRNNNSFIKSGKTNFIRKKCKCSPIKSYRNLFEDNFFFAGFVSFKSFGNSINNKLGFEIKLLSEFVINQIMEFKLMSTFMFKSFVSRILTSQFITFKKFKKLRFLRNFQLDSSSTFHKIKEIRVIFKSYECPMEVSVFSPINKFMGIQNTKVL